MNKLIKYFTSFLCIILLLTLQQVIVAESSKTGPVFHDYGAVYDITDLAVPLKKNYRYKVLFDISKDSDLKETINKNVDSIARYINMHVRHGVTLENIDIAVVLHGKATRNGLNHETYEKRYAMKNPTLDLIKQLSAKGVKFYQCGQSAYSQKVSAKELTGEVKMALSAMTMLTELQSEGYQLLP